MIPIHQDKLNHTIQKYHTEIESHLIHVKREITNWLNHKTWKVSKKAKKVHKLGHAQELYLRYLRYQLDNLVYANMDSLEKHKSTFDRITQQIKKSDFKPFKDHLIKIMGYGKLRSDEKCALYPKFYKTLGIKVCVYCNSQLTITVEDVSKKKVARFQVDHFIDKAKYPCFSISFFNLYPVCASCNNKKGSDSVGFKLYSSDTNATIKSGYNFTIRKSSLAVFRLSKNEQLLEIEFDDNGHGLNKKFAVQGIYATQKDIAAEIITKAEIYNDSYKESLKASFNKLYGRKGIANINFNRFILGNYTDPKDIHKRPMAKFTQDIARQLGLIP